MPVPVHLTVCLWTVRENWSPWMNDLLQNWDNKENCTVGNNKPAYIRLM